jgi:hypothetical protein
MTLAGVWKNEYGSIMTLKLAEPNMLTGTYQSSTGSSGTYRVIGYETDAEPTPNSGVVFLSKRDFSPFKRGLFAYPSQFPGQSIGSSGIQCWRT